MKKAEVIYKENVYCSECNEEIYQCDKCNEYFIDGYKVYCIEGWKHICESCKE